MSPEPPAAVRAAACAAAGDGKEEAVIDPSDLGWMAAVLDLKGTVIVKRNATRATPQVVLMVESKNRAAILKMCAMTGQSVELKNQNQLPPEWARRGCVEHCPEAHIHQAEEKPLPMTSRWTVTGASAAVILHSLRPYLTSWADRGYAEAYDQTLGEAVLTGRGSGATRSSLARLVGLGWPLPGGWAQELMDTPALALPAAG